MINNTICQDYSFVALLKMYAFTTTKHEFYEGKTEQSGFRCFTTDQLKEAHLDFYFKEFLFPQKRLFISEIEVPDDATVIPIGPYYLSDKIIFLNCMEVSDVSTLKHLEEIGIEFEGSHEGYVFIKYTILYGSLDAYKYIHYKYPNNRYYFSDNCSFLVTFISNIVLFCTPEKLQYILENDITYHNLKFNQDIFQYIAEYNNLELFKILFTKGLASDELNQQCLEKALIEAIVNANLEMVKFISKKMNSINQIEIDFSKLSKMVNRFDIIYHLVSKGYPMNNFVDNVSEYFHESEGGIVFLKFCLDNGMTSKNAGKTIFNCIINHNYEAVEFLLKQGMGFEYLQNKPMLKYCVEENNASVFRLILNNVPNPNTFELGEAIIRNDALEFLEILMEHGYDMDIFTDDDFAYFNFIDSNQKKVINWFAKLDLPLDTYYKYQYALFIALLRSHNFRKTNELIADGFCLTDGILPIIMFFIIDKTVQQYIFSKQLPIYLLHSDHDLFFRSIIRTNDISYISACYTKINPHDGNLIDVLIDNNNTQVIDLICQKSADPNYGRRLLIVALIGGHHAIAKHLIEKGYLFTPNDYPEIFVNMNINIQTLWLMINNGLTKEQLMECVLLENIAGNTLVFQFLVTNGLTLETIKASPDFIAEVIIHNNLEIVEIIKHMGVTINDIPSDVLDNYADTKIMKYLIN